MEVETVVGAAVRPPVSAAGHTVGERGAEAPKGGPLPREAPPAWEVARGLPAGEPAQLGTGLACACPYPVSLRAFFRVPIFT